MVVPPVLYASWLLKYKRGNIYLVSGFIPKYRGGKFLFHKFQHKIQIHDSLKAKNVYKDGSCIPSGQFSSVAQSCETLWDPMNCSTPGFPVHHQLLRLTSIESVMPSSHLILCRPLLLLPPIPPNIRVFSNESTLHMRWPKYWSFSLSSFLPKKSQGWSPSEWLAFRGIQTRTGFPGGTSGKEPACQGRRCEMWVWSLGWDDPLKEGMATHSSILNWRIPMDRGTWWATVQSIAKSPIWLK